MFFFGAVLQVHLPETSVGSLEELKIHSHDSRCGTRCTILALLRCVMNNDAVLSHAVSRDVVDFFVWVLRHVPKLLLRVRIHTRHFLFSTCVKVCSTDDCCGDRGVAQAHLAPAAVEIAPSSEAGKSLVSLQRLEFPPGKNSCVIESKSENCSPLANHACKS